MKIVFATNNKHKLDEVRKIIGEVQGAIGETIEVLSLEDIGCTADIPETGETLEENALMKAEYIYNEYGLSVFADDTGLEVDALGGAPGIYSARYAAMEAVEKKNSGAPDGDQPMPAQSHDANANMNRLMREMEGKSDRRARFKTVIALLEAPEVPKLDDASPLIMRAIPKISIFEGIVEGEIISERRGREGFGYDPIFRPEGYAETFAELGNDIKNAISHRARATQKLAEYIKIGSEKHQIPLKRSFEDDREKLRNH